MKLGQSQHRASSASSPCAKHKQAQRGDREETTDVLIRLVERTKGVESAMKRKSKRKPGDKRKSRRKGLKERALVCLVCCVYFFKHISVKSFFLKSYFHYILQMLA